LAYATYNYDDQNVDGDPGSGNFRIYSNSKLLIDDNDSGTIDRSAWYALWQSSQKIFIHDVADATAFTILNITSAPVDKTGYFEVTISAITTSAGFTSLVDNTTCRVYHLSNYDDDTGSYINDEAYKAFDDFTTDINPKVFFLEINRDSYSTSNTPTPDLFNDYLARWVQDVNSGDKGEVWVGTESSPAYSIYEIDKRLNGPITEFEGVDGVTTYRVPTQFARGDFPVRTSSDQYMRVMLLRGQASGSTTYRTSFTNANLTAGVLTVVHDLGNKFVSVFVYDNSNQLVLPDQITLTNDYSLLIDLSGFGTITGTWNLAIFA
jgi:hypothetical protein